MVAVVLRPCSRTEKDLVWHMTAGPAGICTAGFNSGSAGHPLASALRRTFQSLCLDYTAPPTGACSTVPTCVLHMLGCVACQPYAHHGGVEAVGAITSWCINACKLRSMSAQQIQVSIESMIRTML